MSLILCYTPTKPHQQWQLACDVNAPSSMYNKKLHCDTQGGWVGPETEPKYWLLPMTRNNPQHAFSWSSHGRYHDRLPYLGACSLAKHSIKNEGPHFFTLYQPSRSSISRLRKFQKISKRVSSPWPHFFPKFSAFQISLQSVFLSCTETDMTSQDAIFLIKQDEERGTWRCRYLRVVVHLKQTANRIGQHCSCRKSWKLSTYQDWQDFMYLLLMGGGYFHS